MDDQTYKRRVTTGLLIVAVIALFAGLVAFPEWAAFVLPLVGR